MKKKKKTEKVTARKNKFTLLKKLFDVSFHKTKLFQFVLALFVFVILVIFFDAISLKNKVFFENGYSVEVEIRDDDQGRALGLMRRKYLAENKGMLFIFENATNASFWMKNMTIPLDIIYLNDEHFIVQMYENLEPCTNNPCSTYPSNQEIRYAIELRAGFITRNNISLGQLVTFQLDNYKQKE